MLHREFFRCPDIKNMQRVFSRVVYVGFGWLQLSPNPMVSDTTILVRGREARKDENRVSKYERA
jgi:hypothetical protein